MLSLKEELKRRRGLPGMYLRKSRNEKKHKSCYVSISFGPDIMIDAGLCKAERLDMVLENGSLKFFEGILPDAGWRIIRPGRSKVGYMRIPYQEGYPFILNDFNRHRVKEIVIDAEKKTITIATAT